MITLFVILSATSKLLVVSLCGCVCPIVLFVNVFVVFKGTTKMLIVISGFTCLYKCIFLIICKFSSFSMRNRESMFCTAFLSKKTNLLDFNIKIAICNISHKLLRPSQFSEKFMKILEWSTLQK